MPNVGRRLQGEEEGGAVVAEVAVGGVEWERWSKPRQQAGRRHHGSKKGYHRSDHESCRAKWKMADGSSREEDGSMVRSQNDRWGDDAS